MSNLVKMLERLHTKFVKAVNTICKGAIETETTCLRKPMTSLEHYLCTQVRFFGDPGVYLELYTKIEGEDRPLVWVEGPQLRTSFRVFNQDLHTILTFAMSPILHREFTERGQWVLSGMGDLTYTLGADNPWPDSRLTSFYLSNHHRFTLYTGNGQPCLEWWFDLKCETYRLSFRKPKALDIHLWWCEVLDKMMRP